MADMLRGKMKKSGSRMHVGKGSMNHIGAVPYRFRIDVFISYVDHIKNATDVCMTWERRGHQQATSISKVKEGRAVFKENLSMESTLFRRGGNASKGPTAGSSEETLKFDEKKAKFLLKKGSPDGKAIGKIHLNVAEYVRGPHSTVFADMKLSNGAIVVTKIEATMLHMGKKKKNGSKAGSEACSEMTDQNSLENDSLFGDDDQDLGDIEIETTPGPPEEKSTSQVLSSPVSSMAPSSTQSLPRKSGPETAATPPASMESQRKGSFGSGAASSATPSKKSSQRGVQSLKEEEGLKESPSFRNRLRKKKKGKKDKGKEDAADTAGSHQKNSLSTEEPAEIAELKALVDSLKKENAKLKSSKQAAMDEIDALRADLESCEAALENGSGNANSSGSLDLSKTLKEKDKLVAELEAQNEALLEELEEIHEGAVDSAVGVASGQITKLKDKIEDLEVALRREPQYLDVVNELKVTKVSLALANMEKEQALFALQTHCGRPEESE